MSGVEGALASLAELAAAATDHDEVPLHADTFPPAAYLAAETTRVVVLWFKWYSVRRSVLLAREVPHHTVVHLSGTPTAEQLRAVRALRDEYGCPVEFVGDLDPHAVAMFWIVREQARSLGFDVAYRGVDSHWVSLCRAHRTRDLGDCCIALSAFERRLLAWVEDDAGLDLAATLGDEALAILRGGMKLELEGASNPDLYDASFPEALREHLFGPR